jgi:hypothetical protein
MVNATILCLVPDVCKLSRVIVEKPVVVPLHRAVALAGHAPKSFQVGDLDASSAVANETGFLEDVSNRRNAASLHAKHLRKEFLSEQQNIAS